MATQICPNCQSTNLRLSRTHGFKEAFLKLFKRKPFRCKDCGWRGIMFARESKGRNVSKQKAYVFAAVFSLVVLVLLVIFNLRPEVIEKIIRQFIGAPK